MVKRLRMIAGPNGSGKSSLFVQLKQKVNIGYWLNADEVEAALKRIGFIELSNYDFLDEDTKRFNLSKPLQCQFVDNRLYPNQCTIIDSYLASNIVEFLRYTLIQKGSTMTFETVMSHSSKLDFIRNAKEHGYKIYLYFICLESPYLNVKRVQERVKLGGHNVAEEKVKSRYIRTLENAYDAMIICDRAFFFDNSGEEIQLLAEFDSTFHNDTNRHDDTITYRGTQLKGGIKLNSNNIPVWFDRFILQKIKKS